MTDDHKQKVVNAKFTELEDNGSYKPRAFWTKIKGTVAGIFKRKERPAPKQIPILLEDNDKS